MEKVTHGSQMPYAATARHNSASLQLHGDRTQRRKAWPHNVDDDWLEVDGKALGAVSNRCELCRIALPRPGQRCSAVRITQINNSRLGRFQRLFAMA